MKDNGVARWLTVAIVTVLLGLGPASVEAAEQKVVETTFEPGHVSFKPLVSNEGLTLTVSGPDHYKFVRAFEKGETPTFMAVPKDGTRLADGSYTYEIKATPELDEETRRLLTMARQQGDKSVIAELRSKGERSVEPLVQSGWMTVHNGAFVSPSESELVDKTIVHSDDVVIDGSLCVGNDCYSGLAFGFDTVVLMENNLRIFFDDTSTIQNYPRNDWRIITNDSTNGGGSYFAIQDATEVSDILLLEAGAPDNSLYVDSHGDVGINTSTPYYELHIVDGDSPTVRLEQDSSYGWSPQKWDLAGNESNFFIRDATHASKLPFRIEPEAPTDSIFIKSNGNVGFGTGSPDAPLHTERSGGTASAKTMLHLENNGGVRFDFEDTNAGGFWRFQTANSNNELQITRSGTGATELSLDNNGNLTARGDINSGGTTVVPDYVFSPDYSLMSIPDLEAFVTREKHLPGVPSAAEIEQQGSVNLSKMQMRLLEKIEELTLYTLAQEERLNQLGEENADLKARLAALEEAQD